MKPKLLVDIDGVLAEQAGMIRIAADVTRGRFRPALDHWQHYHLTECPDAAGECLSSEEWKEVLRRYGDPEAIRRLPVIPGAPMALTALADLFQVAIVTTRRPELRDATERWLADWAAFPHTLDFVPHRRKHEVLGVSIAVEDDYDQATLFAEIGVPCYLMAWPWNSGRSPIPGVTWAAGWPELADRILCEAAENRAR